LKSEGRRGRATADPSIFNSNRSGSLQVWKRSLATGEIKPIGPGDTNESSESDDGKFLVFTNSAYELWRCHSDGTGVEPLSSGLHPEPGLDCRWLTTEFTSRVTREKKRAFLLPLF